MEKKILLLNLPTNHKYLTLLKNRLELIVRDEIKNINYSKNVDLEIDIDNLINNNKNIDLIKYLKKKYFGNKKLNGIDICKNYLIRKI